MVTASALRQNIYKLLDQVIESGEALEINRKGHLLKIIPEEKVSKFASMTKRDIFVKPDDEGDDIAGMDWSKEWNADIY